MPRESFEIVGSFNNQRIGELDSERTINMFEFIDPMGKKPKALFPTPGIETTITFVETGGVRGMFVFKDFMYEVVDGHIYRTDLAFVTTLIGTISNTSGYVGIDANTFQIIFVNGQNGYIYDTNTGLFSVITDISFPPRPIDVTALDNFFIVANGDTPTWYVSENNNGLIWGLLRTTFTIAVPPTDTLILTTPTTYQTGTPVTVYYGGTTTNNWTITSPPTTILNIVGSAAPYTLNHQVQVNSIGGTLPAPLAPSTTYFCIPVDGTHISLSATSGGAAINMTTAGSGTFTITDIVGSLPAPLNINITYYAIFVDASHIKLATTAANAAAGIPIIMTTTGSGTFTVTNNGELQSANITTHPGNIVACRTLHRRLFLFGQTFTEIWENAGTANFPFRRNNAFLIELGTVHASSIKTGFDKMFFLSQDRDGLGSVMMVTGVQAIPISNSALDFQLQNFADPSDCDVALYRENGIIFYRLNFTTDNHTYVYNVSMSAPQQPLWHEEQMLNGDRNVCGVNANFQGDNYFGAYNKPTVYYLDDTLITNDGEVIPRIRITRDFVRPDYKGVRIHRMQTDLLQGMVDDPGINENPVVFISISKDGGVTYGARIPALMGKLGQRTYRTVWRKLATVRRGQGLICKWECFNKIQFTIFGAAWDYEDLLE